MDWRWVFQWIPCAWVFPSLQPHAKVRGHSVPLLDRDDEDHVLNALSMHQIPLLVDLDDFSYS